jgi:signal transduction histidine kinase
VTSGRKQTSLLARVVAVIGLAFFAIELVVLAVFTGGYWAWLTSDRQDAIHMHATRVREHVRRALLERAQPPNDDLVDENLDAAVKSGERKGGAPAAIPANLEPDAPIEVWVLTRAGDPFQFVSGQLVPVHRAAWPGASWSPEVKKRVDALFTTSVVGDSAVAELPRDRTSLLDRKMVRAEPIFVAGQGQPDAVLWLESRLEDLRTQVVTYGLVAFASGAMALFITAMVVLAYLRRALLLPLSRLIAADNAARRGEEGAAIIDEGDIPDDEVGAIMRSRNHLYLAMVKGRRDLDEKNAILARQGEELRRWGEQLERLVHEKTSALLKASDRLHRTEKLAALGRLAANVAHEINNPLACIAGYAEEARDQLDASADPDLLAALKTIEEQAFRCKEILKRLLGLARADQLELRPVPLRKLVLESARLGEHTARRRGVVVRVDDDHGFGDGPTIPSDPAWLQQVILNLVDNAVDAAGAELPPDLPAQAALGQGRAWVRLTVREDVDEVHIVVSDSGRGVPEALRERIFDPFYTTKPVGRGTGLGLAISQSLVERLGGRLSVEQAPGAGAAFTVHLPKRALESGRLPRVAAADASEAVEVGLHAGGMAGVDPDA